VFHGWYRLIYWFIISVERNAHLSQLQSLGRLQIDQTQSTFAGNLVQGLVCLQCLECGTDHIEWVTIAVGLGHDVGNTKKFQNITDEWIAPKCSVSGPQIYFARVLAADQIACQSSIAVAVNEKEVSFGHSTGSFDGILGFKGFSNSKATAASEISTNDKGSVGFNAATTPHFANAVGANEDFAPVAIVC